MPYEDNLDKLVRNKLTREDLGRGPQSMPQMTPVQPPAQPSILDILHGLGHAPIGQGFSLPPGHEMQIKGPPAPEPPPQAPAPSPAQMNPTPGPTPMGMPAPPPSPPIMPQPTAAMPAAPVDPMALIRRLFGGPAMAQGAPGA